MYFFCPDFCFLQGCFYSAVVPDRLVFKGYFEPVFFVCVCFCPGYCFEGKFLFLLFWFSTKAAGGSVEGDRKDAVVVGERGQFRFLARKYFRFFSFRLSFVRLYQYILTIFLVSNGRTMDKEFSKQVLTLKLPYVSHQKKRRLQVFAMGNAELSGACTFVVPPFSIFFFSRAELYEQRQFSISFFLTFFVSEGFR